MKKEFIDNNFLEIMYITALVESFASNDSEKKVGAALFRFDERLKTYRYIASGANKFCLPDRKSMLEKSNIPCRYQYELPSSGSDKYKHIIHAEVRAVINCLLQKEAIDSSVILFSTLSPCLNCLRFLCACGIRHIIFKDWHRTVSVEDYLNFDVPVSLCDITLDTLREGKVELTYLKL